MAIAVTQLAGAVVGAQHAGGPPLRTELDLAGGFVRLAGNALTDRTVDTLSVERWRPGVSVGVRWTRWFELNASVKPGLHLELREAWGFADDKDARAVVDHRPGAIVTVEGRLFAPRPDVYAAFGVLHARPARYAMAVTRTGPTLQLGQGDHATDVTATWRARGRTTLAVGAGYSRRVRRSLTFTSGVSVPLDFPAYTPIDLMFRQGVDVTPADRESALRVLARETFYAPIAFQMSLGWTF